MSVTQVKPPTKRTRKGLKLSGKRTKGTRRDGANRGVGKYRRPRCGGCLFCSRESAIKFARRKADLDFAEQVAGLYELAS